MTEKRKPLLAGDRVRLYLTLVPYLLERRQVPLEEAATEFGITPQELRSMVEKLTLIGLPGDSGFWQQPQELFDINWDLLDTEGVIEITNEVGLRRVPRFTAREAAALLAGLQLVASVPSVAASDLVTGLLAKLSSGASAAPLEVVVAPPALDEVRDVVSQALNEGVAVSFTYQAPDAGATTRTVDPVRVLTSNGEWYLQGWCHLREAMRTFHLDRVRNPLLTDLPVSHQADNLPELFEGDPDEDLGEIRMPANIAGLLGDVLAHAETSEAGGIVTARLRMSDPRGLKRVAGRFGGQAEVTAPAVARAATREWAAAGLALYHERTPGVGR
ncbi:helix-turn-helix transcriptional regulator [Microbacterium sp. NIBRBAC000506063]|uniref:helix-turn-helix transcriptional regulator n=1 Tax=Microbacterium sp. NIBRBAC000506063 TaxID=2734618 RepID=UPI001BB4C696|nr:WYL domain-containing protein [Microbacterium sp. NIBRBAC000506063]QTV80823.1 WYL domain-containing protein [Microbacterium sp. NIBRBAC000506063]